VNESCSSETKTVEQLLQDLRQHDWSVNWKTADALAEAGEQAFPHLLQALKDTDGYVRNGAAIALGKIGNSDATEPLIGALQWRDDRVYEDDEDREALTSAATALGKLRNVAACQVLRAELGKFPSSVDSTLASYIAEALAEIGDPEAVPVLAKAVEAGDFELIGVASRALAKLGAAGIKELLRLGANRAQHGRALIIRALGTNSVRSATPLLLQILHEPSGDKFVRCQAAEALGKIGESSEVFPILLAMLQSADEEVRPGVLSGLGALHDARAYGAIVKQLDSPRHRYTAIMALGVLGDPRACDLLTKMLKSEDESSAIHAATALGKIGCHDALPLLTQLHERMTTSDSPVSKANAGAVERAVQKLQERRNRSTPE
jgi:HEAT repeat protein